MTKRFKAIVRAVLKNGHAYAAYWTDEGTAETGPIGYSEVGYRWGQLRLSIRPNGSVYLERNSNGGFDAFGEPDFFSTLVDSHIVDKRRRDVSAYYYAALLRKLLGHSSYRSYLRIYSETRWWHRYARMLNRAWDYIAEDVFTLDWDNGRDYGSNVELSRDEVIELTLDADRPRELGGDPEAAERFSKLPREKKLEIARSIFRAERYCY